MPPQQPGQPGQPGQPEQLDQSSHPGQPSHFNTDDPDGGGESKSDNEVSIIQKPMSSLNSLSLRDSPHVSTSLSVHSETASLSSSSATASFSAPSATASFSASIATPPSPNKRPRTSDSIENVGIHFCV